MSGFDTNNFFSQGATDVAISESSDPINVEHCIYGSNEKVLERLLRYDGEYAPFCQSIVIEGEFIESDAARCPIRQVIMGITPENLIIACRIVPCVKDMILRGQQMLAKGGGDYRSLLGLLGKVVVDRKAHVKAVILGQQDATLVGDLELSSIVPLQCIKLTFLRHDTMRLTYGDSDNKHYELTTTQMNGNLKDSLNLWKRTAPRFIDAKWTDLLIRLRQQHVNEEVKLKPEEYAHKKVVSFEQDVSKQGKLKTTKFKAAVHQTIQEQKKQKPEAKKEAKTKVPETQKTAPNQRRVSMADATILFRAAAKQVIDTNKGKTEQKKKKKTGVFGGIKKRFFKS